MKRLHFRSDAVSTLRSLGDRTDKLERRRPDSGTTGSVFGVRSIGRTGSIHSATTTTWATFARVPTGRFLLDYAVFFRPADGVDLVTTEVNIALDPGDLNGGGAGLIDAQTSYASHRFLANFRWPGLGDLDVQVRATSSDGSDVTVSAAFVLTPVMSG